MFIGRKYGNDLVRRRTDITVVIGVVVHGASLSYITAAGWLSRSKVRLKFNLGSQYIIVIISVPGKSIRFYIRRAVTTTVRNWGLKLWNRPQRTRGALQSAGDKHRYCLRFRFICPAVSSARNADEWRKNELQKKKKNDKNITCKLYVKSSRPISVG